MYTLDTNAIIYYLREDAIAGSLRRQHNIKTADSIVAATALFTGTTLITRNIRDFQKIPNLILRKV